MGAALRLKLNLKESPSDFKMTNSVLLAVLSVCTLMQPLVSGCGTPDDRLSRVIGGKYVENAAWPWQAMLMYQNRPRCGGSLISPEWILTAAHCVNRKSAGGFKIVLGHHSRRVSLAQQIAVSKIIIHPSYRPEYYHDIALMKLAKPAMITRTVKTVCVPEAGERPAPGTQCYITGYGKEKHPGSFVAYLKQAMLPVVSNAVCQKLNSGIMRLPITDDMICAGHGGNDRRGGCHGDSGGPFVCQAPNGRWVLQGAVSTGNERNCDARKAYTVFVRPAYFRDWIRSETGV